MNKNLAISIVVIILAAGAGYWTWSQRDTEDWRETLENVPPFSYTNPEVRYTGDSIHSRESVYLEYFKKCSVEEFDIDMTSFEILSPGGYAAGYARDNNHVWYLGRDESFTGPGGCSVREIKDVHPADFRVVRLGDKSESGEGLYEYGTLDNAVYHAGVELLGLDLGSINLIDDAYISDGVNVFYTSAYFRHPNITNKLEGVNLTTLKIDDIIATDGSNVYFFGKRQEHIDGTTFVSLNTIYKKDKDQVFLKISGGCEGEPYITQLIGADAPTFELLRNEPYANATKDKNHVYIYGRIVDGADPATVEIKPDNSIWDKNGLLGYYSSIPPC